MFDSNIHRLMYHAGNIIERHDPINLSVSATSECNLKCNFCYLKNRNIGEVDLNALIHFINSVKPASVDITGGEPFLYSSLDELIKFLRKSNIKFGIITNGTIAKTEIINMSVWTRVSVNTYIDGGFPEKNLYKIEKCLESYVDYGFNYIYTGDCDDNALLSQLYEFSGRHLRSQYLRISADVNKRDDNSFRIRYSRLNPLVKNIYKKGFISLKNSPPKCFMGRLKPLIEPDGFVYRCSAEAAGWFPKAPICSLNDPESFLNYKYQGHMCDNCHHYEINKFVQDVFDQHHTNFI